MEKTDKYKLLYVSTHNADIDPGVEKKIQGICKAASRKGFIVERITHNCKTMHERIDLMRKVSKTDARYIIFRSFGFLTILVRGYLRRMRNEGHILICDQPTPLSATLREIWFSSKSIEKKLYYTGWGLLSGPWSMYPFHRIIQYAPESIFFSYGNRKKTILVGNGIDFIRISKRVKHVNKNCEQIKLVGVANTSVHHGFDRVIKSIAVFNSKNKNKAYFDIIGGDLTSSIIQSLIKMSNNLNVNNYVFFHGFKDQEFINTKYSMADLAVGSLGLFRIGLHFSSILKIREYCLAGIPFISAGIDPDFPTDVPFRFIVPNNESIEPIVKVLEDFFDRRETFTDEQIRQYAITHFSFDAKFDQIMKGLI